MIAKLITKTNSLGTLTWLMGLQAFAGNESSGIPYPWDYITLAALIVFILWFFFAKQQQRRKLEREVLMRTSKLQAQKDELEALEGILKAINREIELPELLSTMLKQGINLFPQAQKGAFLLWNDEKEVFEFVASIGYDLDELKKFQFTFDEATQRYITRSQRLEEEIYLARRLQGHADPLEGLQRARATLCMPVAIEDQLSGMLLLDNLTNEHAFDHFDITRLNRFRDHAVFAINKAKTVNQLRIKNEEILEAQRQTIINEKMASLGLVTAGVAHEINNPVNFTHGSAQNLMTEMNEFKHFLFELAGDDADQDLLKSLSNSLDPLFEKVKLIEEGTTRISSIVRDLHSVARSGEADKQDANLHQHILSTIHLVASNFKEQIHFHWDIEENLILHCRVSELNQVFMNLLVNGCHAILKAQSDQTLRGPGEIRVGAHRHAGEIVVVVEDNGTGITDKVLPHIFEPFFTTKNDGEGSGLGLAISYKIMEGHKGRIQVKTQVGEGSTFKVVLPLEQ